MPLLAVIRRHCLYYSLIRIFRINTSVSRLLLACNPNVSLC
jgi:hypothetical protein